MADNNYQSHYAKANLIIDGEVIPPYGIDPKRYSDILKFSICDGVLVAGCTVFGGVENCSDAVRGSSYFWDACRLVMRHPGKGALTIKGAIDGWSLKNCIFDGHGDEYDVEVGQFDNYWYPGRAATRDGTIEDCHSEDGQPIKVVLWNADKPQVVGGNVKIIKMPWIIWFPYFLFRYIQTKINPPK